MTTGQLLGVGAVCAVVAVAAVMYHRAVVDAAGKQAAKEVESMAIGKGNDLVRGVTTTAQQAFAALGFKPALGGLL